MRHNRGFLLLAVLPFALSVGAFVMLALAATGSDLRLEQLRRYRARAYYEAESALAVAQALVKSSEYDASGNVYLRTALAGEPTDLRNAAGASVHVLYTADRAEVVVSELAPGLFQLDAMARVGPACAQLRSLVRERDSFARYTLFVNGANINLGGALSDGRIHSNRAIRFRFPGHTYPTVTAVNGFMYVDGASATNTTLGAGSNGSVAEVPMPDLGDIEGRRAHADGALEDLLRGKNWSQYNVSLEFLGNGYELTATPKSGGAPLRTGKLPLPSEGVIYIATNLAGLKGTLNGRVTLAVTGSVTITGSLQYVDSAGRTAYLNGLPTDPSLPYEPNPAYTGNSALGVMAGGSIVYGSAVGQQLELNAYFFSRGMFGVPNGSYGVRNTLRSLGGHTVETGVVGAYVTSSGTVTAGFRNRTYRFDRALAENPPPHFLAIDEPQFSAVRLVDGSGQVGSDEPDAWNLSPRRLGRRDNGNHFAYGHARAPGQQ
jgi:hypothetical protein